MSVFNSIGMGVCHCIFERMEDVSKCACVSGCSSMHRLMCVGLGVCVRGVGYCVYEYTFELCEFLYRAVLCVCGLWRSVSLGDTVRVSSQIARRPHLP